MNKIKNGTLIKDQKVREDGTYWIVFNINESNNRCCLINFNLYVIHNFTFSELCKDWCVKFF